jgi:hypothetical protein
VRRLVRAADKHTEELGDDESAVGPKASLKGISTGMDMLKGRSKKVSVLFFSLNNS